MSGSFNGQILVDKLSKLNNSQQSIETLSHWCIFHRNKAKQVVETWERQFHTSPREQRVCFLYLANDILQNSRRKGLEFINEFWRVLPDALADVYGNGDDFGRKAVLRLVDIWDERKVFGSSGQILKQEIVGRKLEKIHNSGKSINDNLKQSNRTLLDKIISSYGPIGNEDALFGKCQGAINIVDKVEKQLGSDTEIGSSIGSEVIGELHIQHGILGECIEQLKSSELSRATLISLLKESLHEQEIMIEQVRHQLQTAESRYKQVEYISAQLNGEQPSMSNKRPRESSSPFSTTPPGFASEATVSCTDEAQALTKYPSEETHTDNKPSHTEEEQRKTAAAAVAAKLTASASSAQMLSFVLSSLASEGIISQASSEDSSDSKQPKLENNLPPSNPVLQLPMPSFSQPDSLHQLPQLQSPSSATHLNTSMEPPLSTSVPPATLPLPASTQYLQSAAGPMTGVPYSYGSASPPLPNFPMFGVLPNPSVPNPFYSFQASDGANRIVQPPLPAGPPPLTRQ